MQLTPDQIAHYNDSKQHTIVGVFVAFLVLSNVAVIIRIAAQLRLSKRLFLDDFAIIFADLTSNAVIALYLYATHNGLGLHLYRVIDQDPHLPSDLITLFRALYFNAVLAGPTITAVKISLLWYYRRMFLVNQKWLRIFWWINFIYIILWGIGATTYYILQCYPPEYYWQRWYVALNIPHDPPIVGTCEHSTSIDVGIPLLLGLISDFTVWLLPIVTLAKLQMHLKQKMGVILIFSTGLAACGCAVARLVLELDSAHALSDPTYGLVPFVILSCSETVIAIVAACAPLIASEWKWMMGKARGPSADNLAVPLHTNSRKVFSTHPNDSGSCMESIHKDGDTNSLNTSEGSNAPEEGQIQVTRQVDVAWACRNIAT